MVRAVACCCMDSEDPLTREAELESLLVTAPHELLHVVAWLDAAGGRTPLEVFDQEDGETALADMLRRLEAGDGGEDRIERLARRIAARCGAATVAAHAGPVAEAVGAEFSAPAASRS